MKRGRERLIDVLVAAVVITAMSAATAFASPVSDRMRRLPNGGTQYSLDGYATLCGARAGIGGWAHDAISLVDAGGNAHAVPSSLMNGGTAFTIGYQP